MITGLLSVKSFAPSKAEMDTVGRFGGEPGSGTVFAIAVAISVGELDETGMEGLSDILRL